MKKTYSTPGISFLSLSSSGLSSGCAYQASFAANVCPVEVPEWDGETIFSDYKNCDWTPQDKVCYDVPTASSNVFES